MTKYILIFPLCLILICCQKKDYELELCFEGMKERIGTDSVLSNIKITTIDSYQTYAALIQKVVAEETKSNKVSLIALNKFKAENDRYSLTVINLLFFQNFQAYLSHMPFNKEVAIKKALEFEMKWK